MNLNFSQSTGLVTMDDGAHVAMGWSGNGEGKCNPAMQHVRDVGPLPQGVYRIGPWQDHPHLGRMVAPLTQIAGETFGRDDFLIHGPSMDPARRGQESKGCCVVPFAGRLQMHNLTPGPDDTLTVTP
jgi:hypothetical protein